MYGHSQMWIFRRARPSHSMSSSSGSRLPLMRNLMQFLSGAKNHVLEGSKGKPLSSFFHAGLERACLLSFQVRAHARTDSDSGSSSAAQVPSGLRGCFCTIRGPVLGATDLAPGPKQRANSTALGSFVSFASFGIKVTFFRGGWRLRFLLAGPFQCRDHVRPSSTTGRVYKQCIKNT